MQKNSSQARLLWEGFLPQKAVLLWFIHSLTLAQSCTSFYSLSLSFCVCFFRKENTREYGAPSPKHCVTTSQRGEQILLSHLWTSGKSVHAGNVCTVLMLELRKEYRTYLETNAFVEDTKFCQNWKVNWVTWVGSYKYVEFCLSFYRFSSISIIKIGNESTMHCNSKILLNNEEAKERLLIVWSSSYKDRFDPADSTNPKICLKTSSIHSIYCENSS